MRSRILIGILLLFSRLPLFVLYRFSDFIFIIVFYLLRYRRNIVARNLNHAFPDKNPEEKKKIQKAFFRHFCDLAVESLKAATISSKELKNRMKYQNLELIRELYQKEKDIILVSGHYANWEWMLATQLYSDYQNISLYHPLANSFFDAFVKHIRERFGARLLPMATALRQLVQYHRNGRLTFSYFLADQTPMSDARFWTIFLNQETAFFEGPARMAHKFGSAFVFLDIRKEKRGFYTAEFKLLCEDASKCSELELMFYYIEILEKQIQKKAEYWLWSHRRWKRKRPDGVALTKRPGV